MKRPSKKGLPGRAISNQPTAEAPASRKRCAPRRGWGNTGGMGSCRKRVRSGSWLSYSPVVAPPPATSKRLAEPKVLPSEQTQAAYEAFLGASDYTKNG